jgi:hypothetical protein
MPDRSANEGKPQAADEKVKELPSQSPSTFARSLASKLAEAKGVSSQVHWGNEGFAVDVALRDPGRPEDVPLGVLCDASRFAGAEDPMEWDVFRTGILEGQGWRLHRVWTPHFFRDPKGATRALLIEAQAAAAEAAREKAEAARPTREKPARK